MEQSISKVDETYEMFDNITQAAEGATAVQMEISQVIDNSKTELNAVCSFFDRMKERYQGLYEGVVILCDSKEESLCERAGGFFFIYSK